MNRREFLSLGAAAGVAAMAGPLVPAAPQRTASRLIIVQFGGGTRFSESIGDPEHRFIPRLWSDLVPLGTLFTNMRVEGKVVHPNSTGSIMTGHWEWDDIDWTRPVAHPTLFEVFRRESGAEDTGAWLFAYASILSKAGVSSAKGYGADWAANVMEPPTISRETAVEMDRLMSGAAAQGKADAEAAAARACAALARRNGRLAQGGLRSAAARDFCADFFRRWQADEGRTTSHDAFIADAAVACMKEFAPRALAVCFGEIDCAHYGSWSRYVEAIQRTDELTYRVWEAVQEHPAYRDRTLMLILPDHGRELDSTGGMGFVHHSDFYKGIGADEGCRRVWMLAVGSGVRRGATVEAAVPITAAASTGLQSMGLKAPLGAAEPAPLA
jgi:hypothetical protein